jgi:hypothetical protein
MWRRVAIGALAAIGAALLALGWMALAPLPADSRELVYVIPKGTGSGGSGTAAAGLPPFVRLTLGLRDVLVFKNEDTIEQTIGPVRLAPGQTYRLPFHQPGAVQLACSFHHGMHFLIFVDPAPAAGWDRLRWRLGLAGA